jgi:hypothetical protein
MFLVALRGLSSQITRPEEIKTYCCQFHTNVKSILMRFGGFSFPKTICIANKDTAPYNLVNIET